MRGRRTDLTMPVMKLIIDAKSEGLSTEESIAKSGVDRATVYRWLNHGKSGKVPYDIFYNAFQDAEKRGFNKRLAELQLVS